MCSICFDSFVVDIELFDVWVWDIVLFVLVDG